jgi:hypothetical protein
MSNAIFIDTWGWLTSDLAPFKKELSGNGFENNFKAITSSNISINSDLSEKF